ncbi:MAG: PatB family C-S lyase [Bacteroidaceae bacterium]|nr:PatB family C-S lyase [Bacteroidaceae bacterium]
MDMIYDFDKPVDRTGSSDFKHAVLKERYGRDDLIALWVADMDWETPQFITDALKKRLEHSLFGYTKDPKDWWPTVAKWIYDHHQWEVKPEWLTYIPGIVKGIGFVINHFVKEDEKVIVQPPIYHPFYLTPQGNKREVVWNPLKKKDDGYYEMDFENLEQVCDDKCKLLILCNPHNPVGITWDWETLKKLAHFCKEHNLLVISDEIHCDMALYGHKHIPFASVSDEAAEISITFSAPSKTFNIAGIVSSWAVVPNDKLREDFYSWLEASEFNEASMFCAIATCAAFKNGEEWRQQMVKYVEGNIDFVIDYCREYIPQIKPIRPMASFLVWLDCTALGLDHDALNDLFVNKARLALNDGEMFGEQGRGCMRLNVGTQRHVLRKALEQLREAVESLK